MSNACTISQQLVQPRKQLEQNGLLEEGGGVASSSLSLNDLNHEVVSHTAVQDCINQCRQTRFDTEIKTKSFSAEPKFKAWKGGSISTNKETATAMFIRRLLADPTKKLTPAQQKYVDEHPHLLAESSPEPQPKPSKRKRDADVASSSKVGKQGDKGKRVGVEVCV